MNPNNPPLGKRDNLVVQEIDNEVLVYDLSNNKAFCLNETSALVWQLCDGKHSVAEISQTLTEKLNSKADEDFVWFALEQLKKEKLVKFNNDQAHPFLGMSRREIIKKVGLGTMLALPIVTSIVAPKAIQAATGCLVVDMTCNCEYQDGMGGNGPGGARTTGICGTILLTMVGNDTCDAGCRCEITNISDANCPLISGTGSNEIHRCSGACIV